MVGIGSTNLRKQSSYKQNDMRMKAILVTAATWKKEKKNLKNGWDLILSVSFSCGSFKSSSPPVNAKF